ncbi:hypothetical protein, partial [Vibrio parahaemolyticus]|uniref:hypothetical protein n=1 Tax=Vibrio parahaemolyticus TaxID=670 RepID=UPI002D1FC20B
MAIRSGFSANQHCLPMRVLSGCLNGVLGLHEVSQFGAKSLWQFCFRFEFSENGSSKFTGFKAGELPQSLNQCGFQNSSGLLVSQIGLISALINLKGLKFKLTNCLSGIRNA